jgi:hypothetical protein
VKPKADVTAERNVKRLLQDSWLSNFAFLLWILRVSLKSYKALIKEIGISGHTWNNYLTKFTSH